MKKFYTFVFLSILLAFSTEFFPQMNTKVSSGTSGSTLLLGSTSAKKTQLLYLPGDFIASVSGSISKIYFMYNSTTSPEYTNFSVSLGQTIETTFAGGAFFTGLTEVLNLPTYSIPAGVIGNWFAIDLSSTFQFDATQTLIVEVKWETNTQTGFSTIYGSGISGKKLYASDPVATTGTSSTSWQNFGYDIEVTNNIAAREILSPVNLSNDPTLPVTAVFENNGSEVMSGKYFASIFSPTGDLLYSDSTDFTNFQPGEYDTAYFNDCSNFTGNGLYQTLAYVKSPTDPVPSDDTVKSNFSRFVQTQPLLVVWTSQYTNGVSNRDSAFTALNSLGVLYDECDRNINPNTDFTPWATILWLEDGSLQEEERLALINFTNAGTKDQEKTIIIFGDDIGYFHGNPTGANYDTTFFWHTLHAQYYQDDPQSSDNNRICGVEINPGLCDSLYSLYPDAIGTLNGSMVAYRFADLPSNSDTVAGVVFDGNTYNIVYFSFEIREVIFPVTKDASQILSGTIDWVFGAGGFPVIPVEMTSFTASVTGNVVLLLWETATETNNLGFEIQRRTAVEQAEFVKIGFVNGNGTSLTPSTFTFRDELSGGSIFEYRLKQIDIDGSYEFSSTIKIELGTPDRYELMQNYPNPFNPLTNIKFGIPKTGPVNLSVYNTLGELVAVLVNREMDAGYHVVQFGNTHLASGIYLCKITVQNQFESIIKMIMLK
ncbi:MAG: T9SS type A sorting domain-containing protein [Ignavibacteriales bacterium]|nr:T9SS type A sorting domain-containing protein [Ignavibacteriales bacterium]MCF8305798.1 T9SS type A sorting domain-containing protein [Ignavibacteriales bacterium]MCF8315520.1 T9SS type A sorting domain-containing protein [Ignavibacteriales bacterium]MCF8436950.1 T9SS type A sorting domain-containing protein [Ignavibacteriales bacterium]